ncbi:exodeoxyribonuclease VII large subunit [Singulisphaera acidiphila]|uniref:Exodeoxyribonuclease VII large subunit n=1 Tax=Singulisphaera acidiphila (strain ATCC BAA-1392 / DSM 18658 / VKM B-2454 / MOB10) TaxID=886293 RepID=L0DH87_SINAD|nr:exodeoxyribonuclease VII large subunit [Singulisphaera acidiphila]AGA28215.1 exonuclease VII, large subunit [Singulisphaera acidiphila DSM 18658]
MTSNSRVDLRVPFVEKEDAKALGARWDSQKKLWYAPPGADLEHLERWVPKDARLPMFSVLSENVSASVSVAEESEKGISLTDLLSQVRGAIEERMPEAVWVRAEISELSGKNGNLYPKLTQRNEQGDILAQSKSVIWRSRAGAIHQKFMEATGEGLKPDIKILCLVKVRFDPLFGLDLIIEDVDPSYTVGDLAAKLARIREWLVREDLYGRNQGLPAPVEFVRVAVISPESSAGLGDFRRETDRLHQAGLCEFLFFGATFQGVNAPSSIRTAINEALAAHRQRPFDVLVIIRGGGSVTDLAWLNDLELARLVCLASIPVLTGIGHERDSTILDEVAHRRFDTPSKVALFIAATIRDNALAAASALAQIKLQVARILSRERTALATQADRLDVGVRSMIQQAEDDHRKFLAVVRTATHFQLREASQSLETGLVRLVDQAEQTLSEAEFTLRQSVESVTHRAQLQLGVQAAMIERAANAVALQATAKVEAVAAELEHCQAQMARDAGRWVKTARGDLEESLADVAGRAVATAEAAKKGVETYARIVVGLGPQATLSRGFSIVRDTADRPITSRAEALRNAEFTVQFHDGNVPVANRDFEGRPVS